jgi:predicted SprT family Zn-dependent metalloprotease
VRPEVNVDLDAARRLALGLMAEHPQFDGWRLAFSTQARRTLGVCRHRQKVIVLSTAFVTLNDEPTVRDIVLHELAHALVGAGHGHDATWKAKAVELGANPDRVCTEVVMPPGEWQATCATCGRVFHQYRRPTRRYWCRRCGADAGTLTFARRS